MNARRDKTDEWEARQDQAKAEKAALEWLDKWCRPVTDPDGKIVATLKRMLARPVLPVEPSPELLRSMYDSYAGACMCGADPMEGAYRTLRAHLTKPATKTVEAHAAADVWRVEYAERYWDGEESWEPRAITFSHQETALAYAQRLNGLAHKCIRVTGPHQQEVPDDGR